MVGIQERNDLGLERGEGDGQGVFQALQKRGVIARPMGGYGLPEYLRLSVGTPEENARAWASLRSVLGR